jgi:hypothetical protein
MLCIKEDDGDSSKSERVLNGHWIHSPVPNSTIVDTHCVALAPSMDVRGVTLSIDAWTSRIRSTTHFVRGSIYTNTFFFAFMTVHIKSLEYNQIGRKKYVCDTIHAFVSPVVVHCELHPKAAGLIYHPSHSNSLTNT